MLSLDKFLPPVIFAKRSKLSPPDISFAGEQSNHFLFAPNTGLLTFQLLSEKKISAGHKIKVKPAKMRERFRIRETSLRETIINIARIANAVQCQDLIVR